MFLVSLDNSVKDLEDDRFPFEEPLYSILSKFLHLHFYYYSNYITIALI